MYSNLKLFPRIINRLKARATEWVTAFQIFVWGAVLLLPNNTFHSSSSFRVIREMVSENALGLIMLFLGSIRLIALAVNGASVLITPWVRMVGAFLGMMIFTLISIGLALSGNISTWIAAWPVVVAVEFLNVYRASSDAREYTNKRVNA